MRHNTPPNMTPASPVDPPIGITDPPRVLHVRVVAGSGGGPDKTILNSPRFVEPGRYVLSAAYIHPAGNRDFQTIRDAAAEARCQLHAFPERSALDPATPLRLARLCRRLGVAIWHGHDYKSNALGLLVRRALGPRSMRLITTVHGWTDESARMRTYARIDRWALRRYERIVAVSDSVASRCLDAGVPAGHLRIIHNAIDADRYARRRSHRQARAELGIEPGVLVAGVVGRMSREKGLDRLIAPMARIAALSRGEPPVRWLWVGDGPDRAALERSLGEAGLRDAVRIVGWQPDTRPWIEAMDALVMPSRTEGLPNAALEAMAMGVPVAATAVGGLPQLLDHGRCGLLLGDAEASWAAPLLGLLRNPAARSELADRALARVRGEYSFQHRMDRMVGVYDELLASADADAPRSSADQRRTNARSAA